MKLRSSLRTDKRGSIWISMGLLLITAALAVAFYNIHEAGRADKAADAAAGKLEEIITEHEPDPKEAALYQTLLEEREMPVEEIDGYAYIGYLSVPALDMTFPVMDTWDYDRLKKAPCRYSGSVYQNDLILAGHNYRRHFGPLRWLEMGSEIHFVDAEGNVWKYVVTNMEILQPDQLEKLTSEEGGWDMSLFTCTSGGQARHVIRCERAD